MNATCPLLTQLCPLTCTMVDALSCLSPHPQSTVKPGFIYVTYFHISIRTEVYRGMSAVRHKCRLPLYHLLPCYMWKITFCYQKNGLEDNLCSYIWQEKNFKVIVKFNKKGIHFQQLEREFSLE
jgi:hypothetical protein